MYVAYQDVAVFYTCRFRQELWAEVDLDAAKEMVSYVAAHVSCTLVTWSLEEWCRISYVCMYIVLCITVLALGLLILVNLHLGWEGGVCVGLTLLFFFVCLFVFF